MGRLFGWNSKGGVVRHYFSMFFLSWILVKIILFIYLCHSGPCYIYIHQPLSTINTKFSKQYGALRIPHWCHKMFFTCWFRTRWCSLRNKWAIQSVITSSYALESSPAWGPLLWASLLKCLNFQEDPTETQCDQMAEDVHIHVIFLCLKW